MKVPARYESATYDDVPEQVKTYLVKMFSEKKGKGLYIHGGVGSGKTHIAYGIKKKLNENGIHVYFWNITNLLAEIKSDFSRNEKRQPVEEFNGESAKEFGRLLVLDDIGAENPTDFVIETLYLIINERYDHMLPTIFTSNYSLGELAERIGDRSASRIAEMCEIVELTGGDRRVR